MVRAMQSHTYRQAFGIAPVIALVGLIACLTTRPAAAQIAFDVRVYYTDNDSIVIKPSNIRLGCDTIPCHHAIVWVFFNGGNAEHTLSLQNFKNKDTSKPEDPLDLASGTGVKSVKIPKKSLGVLAARVSRVPAGTTTYTYDIYIDGNLAQDPELVIERPKPPPPPPPPVR